MKPSILTHLADTLHKLAEIETAMLDPKGPQPCAVLIKRGADSTPPTNQEEKHVLWNMAVSAHADIMKEVAAEYVSPMEFAHGVYGKAIRYLNSSTLKLPGDDATIARVVNALSSRFFNALRQCPNQLSYPGKNSDGQHIFVKLGDLPKDKQDQETNDWHQRLRNSAEARQTSDELAGIAVRLAGDKSASPSSEPSADEEADTLAKMYKRRASLTEASELLSRTERELQTGCEAFDSHYRKLREAWEFSRESHGEADFEAAVYLDQMERVIVDFAFKVRQSPQAGFITEDADWELLPREQSQGIGIDEARISFRHAWKIMTLASEGQSVRHLFWKGWSPQEFKNPALRAYRETTAFVYSIMHIQAGLRSYPVKPVPRGGMTDVITRLKELLTTDQPWEPLTLSEYRYKMELVGREHQRLHLTAALPVFNPDRFDEIIRRLDAILHEIAAIAANQAGTYFQSNKPDSKSQESQIPEPTPSGGVPPKPDETPDTQKLTETMLLVLKQYAHAESILGTPLTDKEAFEWLLKAEELPDDLEMVHSKANMEAWMRALRRGRTIACLNKNQPRAGRTSRSVRRRDEI